MNPLMTVGVLLTVFLVCVKGDDLYTTKYDSVNYEEILQSERLLKNYFNCLMDRGKCTPEGTELKKHIPDALETGCSKCSEKQREGTRKVIHFLIENKKDWWNELAGKYDPEQKYKKKYEDEIKKEGLDI